MSLQTQLLGGNVTSTFFTPFDQIQIEAKVSYDNASQPDMMVYFNVTGPIGTTNPTVVNRIETTNSSGQASLVFRLPAIGGNDSSLVGNWQASATLQTTDGVIQQEVNFTTQWNLQISSINLLDAAGQNQTTFTPGSRIIVEATVSNLGSAAQTANVSMNMEDALDQTLNSTKVQNNQIPNTNQTQIQSTLQVPSDAVAGTDTINVAVYEGTFNGTNIPAAADMAAYFTVASSNNSTSTPTPSPTNQSPTPLPTASQNTVTLFSWLLVTTGLFTFTALTMFLRRKPVQTSPQMPNMPTIQTNPATDTKTKQQSSPTSTATTSPEKTMQAKTVTQAPSILESWRSSTQLNARPQGKLPIEVSEDVASKLSKISETGKKVQSIESALQVEKQQLQQEIDALNEILEQQESEVKNYFDAIRKAISDIFPDQKNKGQPEQEKAREQTKEKNN